jgi:hypothetical protein
VSDVDTNEEIGRMITTDTYSTKSRTVQRHRLLCVRAVSYQSSSAGIIINVGSSIVGNPRWLALGSTCRCSSHLAGEVR